MLARTRRLARAGGDPLAEKRLRVLPHRDVASAVATVRGSTAAAAVKLAFEFLGSR